METEPGKNKNSNYLILLVVVPSLIFIFFIFLRQEPKDDLENINLNDIYNNGRQDKPTNDGNRSSSQNQESSGFNQDFIEKGYSNRDIQELTHWDLEASEVPDLKARKRRGVVNILSVDKKTGKGFCNELVIILKKTPHVKADILNPDLRAMKTYQSREFADTQSNNEIIIKFAIKKIIEAGYTWEYDVCVLEANNSATVSGSSAGSGVYMALLSAFYYDCAIPKNLAITGVLDTEKTEIPTKIKPIPKEFQWQADHCAQCNNYSNFWHIVYDKKSNKLEQSFKNATDPNSQWVFCNQKCYKEWWDEKVYYCSGCWKQGFESCSCCGKYHSWIWESKDSEKFCSEKCINKRYPKDYEEGKIIAIAGLEGKISAAVQEGCDTIVIPKSNSSDYHAEVPLSVRTKVRKLYEVESYQDLKKLLTADL